MAVMRRPAAVAEPRQKARVGAGSVKVNNIQEVQQCDAAVLRDTVEALEGGSVWRGRDRAGLL